MAVVTVAATVSLGAVAALKQLRHQQLSLVLLAIYIYIEQTNKAYINSSIVSTCNISNII